MGVSGRKSGLCLVVTALVIAAGWWVIDTKAWQPLDFDRAWAEKVVEECVPVTQAVQAYQQAKGDPPPYRDALIPEFLVAFPQLTRHAHDRGITAEPMEYRLADDGVAELSLRCLYGIGGGSYDLLLWRSDGNYAQCRDKVRWSFEVNGWVYLVGDQAHYR